MVLWNVVRWYGGMVDRGKVIWRHGVMWNGGRWYGGMMKHGIVELNQNAIP